MKPAFPGALAVVLLGSALPAAAADMTMPFKAPAAYASPLYSWTGCYLGANVGASSMHSTGSVTVTPLVTPFQSIGGALPLSGTNTSSVMGGGQSGCNLQVSNWVFGIEGDIDGKDLSQTRGVVGVPPPAVGLPVGAVSGFIPGDTFTAHSSWQASVRGRLGFAWDRLMIYGTGGVAFTNIQVGANFIPYSIGGIPFPGSVSNGSATLAGPTVGGGLEYAFWQNLSLGVEGRYTWYGERTFSGGSLGVVSVPNSATIVSTPVSQTFKFNTFEATARLNWKFN